MMQGTMSTGELQNVLDTIRWGTEFFIKANTGPTELWVQVGDPKLDHSCWERPEDMDTDRRLYKIDAKNPGTEIAAETAAALAASSIVFFQVDPAYSNVLRQRAIALFEFADQYRGSYWGTCPFYCSFNGYNDELLWAATWLYKATNSVPYLDYIISNMDKSISTSEFSWDNKHAGVQVLLSNVYFSGQESLVKFKNQADKFFCSVLPYSPRAQVTTTPGGLLFFRNGANTQYVTSISFLASVYADYLQAANDMSACADFVFAPDSLLTFAISQVPLTISSFKKQRHPKSFYKQANYILGENPLGISYMVGFGGIYPLEAHHRGASIVSIYDDSTKVNCLLGFTEWFYRPLPNPNLLMGAIVGGPDQWDAFIDWRPNSPQLEPTTYINAPFVGLLAKIYGLYSAY